MQQANLSSALITLDPPRRRQLGAVHLKTHPPAVAAVSISRALAPRPANKMHPCYHVTDARHRGSAARIHGKFTRCTLDLASEVSYIRVDALHELCDLMDDDDKERTYENVVRGFVALDVRVNEDVIPVNFKIVRASRIPESVQFGRDVLDKVAVFVKNDTAQFLPKDCKIEVKKEDGLFRTLVKYLYLFFGVIGHVFEDTRFKTREILSYAAMKMSRKPLEDSTDFTVR